MTRNTTPNEPSGSNRQEMRDVSHTPPTGTESNGVFARGSRAMTDGGRRRDDERDRMRDVDHTPPGENEDANRVFERGHEHARREEAEE